MASMRATRRRPAAVLINSSSSSGHYHAGLRYIIVGTNFLHTVRQYTLHTLKFIEITEFVEIL